MRSWSRTERIMVSKLETCPYCGARRSPKRMPYHEAICLTYNHNGGTKVETKLAFFSHPHSGDVYACEYQLDNQRIIRAAGPVPQREYEAVEPDSPEELEWLDNWLDNADADDATRDGEWLDKQIWPNG